MGVLRVLFDMSRAMNFGMYRPVMGVPSGHRETSSNQSLQEHRRQRHIIARLENPITGEVMSCDTSSDATKSREDSMSVGKPPRGHLAVDLVPTKGPLDHMTGSRDVPQKRLDPSKNRSCGLAGAGSSCVAAVERSHTPRPRSRITESAFGDGFAVREST